MPMAALFEEADQDAVPVLRRQTTLSGHGTSSRANVSSAIADSSNDHSAGLRSVNDEVLKSFLTLSVIAGVSARSGTAVSR